MPFHSRGVQYNFSSVFNPFGNLPKALRLLGFSFPIGILAVQRFLKFPEGIMYLFMLCLFMLCLFFINDIFYDIFIVILFFSRRDYIIYYILYILYISRQGFQRFLKCVCFPIGILAVFESGFFFWFSWFFLLFTGSDSLLKLNRWRC